jgi:hypothetical protein
VPERGTPFIEDLQAREDTLLVPVTQRNRDGLADALLLLLKYNLDPSLQPSFVQGES